MKALFLFLFLTTSAQAGYLCEDPQRGVELEISQHWRVGLTARFRSAEMSQYYRYMNLEIHELVTVVENLAPVSERSENAFRFFQHAPTSSVQMLWGLEVVLTGSQASVALYDSLGKDFSFSLPCVATPDFR